jgi:hypothetical protein
MPQAKRKLEIGLPTPSPAPPILLCSHLAKIYSVSDDVPEQDALLEEISRPNAVVSLECPLRAGSAVRIDCGSCELRGKVTGCKKSPIGYTAEIALPESQPWPRFKPDGLFNPNYLVCKNPGCAPDCVDGDCASQEADAPKAIENDVGEISRRASA